MEIFDDTLDWKRIRKLLTIGLLAGCTVFVSDWILGYGVRDSSLSGVEKSSRNFWCFPMRRFSGQHFSV